MGLFTDLYNTVAKFFRQQDEPMMGEESKKVATNRLKLVLMQDRTNLTPRVLERMRGEMVELLSKYLEMDKDLLELNFEQEGDQVALMLSIPVIRAKDEDEIEKILQEEDSVESEKEDDEVDESNEDMDSEDNEPEEVAEGCSLSEDDSVEAPKKTRKRRSKTVTMPEEMNSESVEIAEENSSDESNDSEGEPVCEHTEG